MFLTPNISKTYYAQIFATSQRQQLFKDTNMLCHFRSWPIIYSVTIFCTKARVQFCGMHPWWRNHIACNHTFDYKTILWNLFFCLCFNFDVCWCWKVNSITGFYIWISSSHLSHSYGWIIRGHSFLIVCTLNDKLISPWCFAVWIPFVFWWIWAW